jgi:hypothetical protein
MSLFEIVTFVVHCACSLFGSMSQLQDLPQDLVNHILLSHGIHPTWLWANMRLVSKSCCETISQPSIWKKICSQLVTVSQELLSSGDAVNWVEIYKNHWKEGPGPLADKFVPHLHETLKTIASSQLSVRSAIEGPTHKNRVQILGKIFRSGMRPIPQKFSEVWFARPRSRKESRLYSIYFASTAYQS